MIVIVARCNLHPSCCFACACVRSVGNPCSRFHFAGAVRPPLKPPRNHTGLPLPCRLACLAPRAPGSWSGQQGRRRTCAATPQGGRAQGARPRAAAGGPCGDAKRGCSRFNERQGASGVHRARAARGQGSEACAVGRGRLVIPAALDQSLCVVWLSAPPGSCWGVGWTRRGSHPCAAPGSATALQLAVHTSCGSTSSGAAKCRRPCSCCAGHRVVEHADAPYGCDVGLQT